MKNFTIDDFELGKPIGRGKFGQVWLAREKSRNFIVALKIMKKAEIAAEPKSVKQIRREIELHSNLDSPFIVKMLGHFHDKYNIYCILEYANGGELFHLLRAEEKFSDKIAARYIFQVAMGLKDMHKIGAIHRDLKPENLLLGSDRRIKICDLGWAVYDMDGRRNTFCGTSEYLSPEIIENDSYSKSVDLWCLGVLAYEFLTGNTPFSRSFTNSSPNLISAVKYSIPSYIGELAKDFIQRLLVKDPKERMNLQDVLMHPWLIKNLDGSFLKYDSNPNL